jgi:uncharacterized membrane protein
MLLLIVGLVLFLGTHSVAIAAPRWRARTIERIGERRWKGAYSLIAVIGLVLVIVGYGEARQQPVLLYATPVYMRHVTALLMLPVFPLVLAAYFPGRIKAALKHPMLAGVKLWAFAHLLANGMLADVLLFGGLLAWAVADRISLKRRPQKPIPQVGAPSVRNDVIAVGAGLVLYAAFVFRLHYWLIGIPIA